MWVVLCALSAVFGFLGLRLFRSAWRVSGAEGWLGLTFLCVGLAMPIRVGVQRSGWMPAVDAPTSLLASHTLMAMGLCGFTLFVHRVFRPDRGWAHLLAASLIGLQILSLPAIVFVGGHRDEQSFVAIATSLVRALPFGWGFLESFRTYRQMRRRVSIGLIDRVSANRFALFAIWTGALFAIPVLLFVIRGWARVATESGRVLGSDSTGQTATALVVGTLVVFGSAATISLWLSFFPPRRFLAYLEGSPLPASS